MLLDRQHIVGDEWWADHTSHRSMRLMRKGCLLYGFPVHKENNRVMRHHIPIATTFRDRMVRRRPCRFIISVRRPFLGIGVPALSRHDDPPERFFSRPFYAPSRRVLDERGERQER